MIKIFSIKEIINASESILNINTKKTKKVLNYKESTSNSKLSKKVKREDFSKPLLLKSTIQNTQSSKIETETKEIKNLTI